MRFVLSAKHLMKIWIRRRRSPGAQIQVLSTGCIGTTRPRTDRLVHQCGGRDQVTMLNDDHGRDDVTKLTDDSLAVVLMRPEVLSSQALTCVFGRCM